MPTILQAMLANRRYIPSIGNHSIAPTILDSPSLGASVAVWLCYASFQKLLRLISQRVGESKRRLNHPDFYGIGRQHFNDIKAEGNVWHLEQSEPVHRSTTDELLLLPINSIQGTAKLLGATGLYLGKNQCLLITADEIDLPSTRCAEVPAKDFPTKSLQVTRGGLLTPLAQGNVVRTRRWAGRPAQNRVDDAGKVHACEA